MENGLMLIISKRHKLYSNLSIIFTMYIVIQTIYSLQQRYLVRRMYKNVYNNLGIY